MINIKEKFLNYFKKKDQICIRGIEWRTHGFITNVTIEGIWLSQLNNKKELLYPWNCFEVAHHCGYYVKKVDPFELKDLFIVKIEKYQIENVRTLLGDFIKEIPATDKELILDSDLKFKKEDSLNLMGQKDHEFPQLKFIINNMIGVSPLTFTVLPFFVGNHYIYGDTTDTIITNKNTLKITILRTAQTVSHGYFNLKYRDKIITVDSQCTLDLLRKDPTTAYKNQLKEEEKRVAAAGDPYLFEGILVGAEKIWRGPQGYLFASPHGELYI